MKAKQLEGIVGVELGLGEAEMVQRFQKLRDMKLLPVSRGRNAEHITVSGIVSGLLSVVPERPGFAGLTTKLLRGLRPVGGAATGFAQAETFAGAIEAAIQDESLLNDLSEIRISDSEIYTNSNGRGAIFYRSGKSERVTYYLRAEALTVSRPGEIYNPRDLISSMIREIVVFPGVLKRIAYQIREEEKYARVMEQFEKQRV